MFQENSVTSDMLIAFCGSEVAIYLINGIRLIGYLSEFDNNGLVLDNGDDQQLIFRQAVATVVPQVGKQEPRRV